MCSQQRTLVTVATYNEMENLPRLVDEVFLVAPQAHLLVIDDNSPDGTGRWADERAEEDSRVHVLHRPGKLGLGTAIVAGMQYALEHQYDYVLNMDADFSHRPQYIPDLLAAMDRPEGPPVDVAVGSRYVAGGGVEGWPWRRRFMSSSINWYARILLGLPVRDCSGAFRCYRASALAKLNFDAIRSRGYSFQEEILWHLKRQGARFAEVPIVFVDRTAGRSKINTREALLALWIIFVLGLRNWTRL